MVLFDGSPMFATKAVMREQYGRLFGDSPGLRVTIASRMTAGDFVIDEEHIAGVQFTGMPESMSALSVYQVTGGKIARLMLLF